jgi:hypothetical protein
VGVIDEIVGTEVRVVGTVLEADDVVSPFLRICENVSPLRVAGLCGIAIGAIEVWKKVRRKCNGLGCRQFSG